MSRAGTVLASVLALGVMAGDAAAQAVRGFVDLHSHLAMEQAFGGSFFWGNADGPMETALRRCDGNFGRNGLPYAIGNGSHAATIYPGLSELIGADTGWHLMRRRGFDERRCRYIGIGRLRVAVPGTCPGEHFEDWPKWDAIAHQQMWHGWLREAHAGGLQVMVVSIAESGFLCSVTPPGRRRFDCDETASVYRQAAYLHDFAFRHADWLGIAESAAEARALIAQGKLALVLSVEITRLFPQGDYRRQLDDFRALGVRSVQVVHHADNRFGGAAPIRSLVLAADAVETIEGRDVTRINDAVCRDASGAVGRCDGDTHLNQLGLTAEGLDLVGAMMERGMIVDVSHLSRHALRDAYGIAMQRGRYPLVYSHTHAFSVVDPAEDRHEKYLRDDEVHYITDTGGMIGLRTGPEHTQWYSGQVPNACQGSIHSFAQSLMYSVDRGLSVGFGADFNGFIKQMKPPQGGECGPFRAPGARPEFGRRGLAHVGLLPDVLADLRRVGTPERYVAHLENSAEVFLQVWERSEAIGAGAAAGNLALRAQASATSTYCVGNGLHCYSPARANDGSRSTAVGGLDSWANDAGVTLPQAWALTWPAPVEVSRVEIYSSEGLAARDYDVQILDAASGQWTTVAEARGNVAAYQTHPFPPVRTRELRVLGRSGPDLQPNHVRLNEVEVY